MVPATEPPQLGLEHHIAFGLQRNEAYHERAVAGLSLHRLIGVRLGSERRNNVRSTLEKLRTYKIPAYALLNAGVRTRPLLGWFGLEANVYNVLDYDYRDDVPRRRRHLHLGS